MRLLRRGRPAGRVHHHPLPPPPPPLPLPPARPCCPHRAHRPDPGIGCTVRGCLCLSPTDPPAPATRPDRRDPIAYVDPGPPVVRDGRRWHLRCPAHPDVQAHSAPFGHPADRPEHHVCYRCGAILFPTHIESPARALRCALADWSER